MINFHGYRTWMPDHPRGYTRHGEGIYAPDTNMADRYAKRAKFDRVIFDELRQQVVVSAIREVCQNIDVDLYYAVCIRTHGHAVVAWRDTRPWTQISDRIKRIVGLKLARSENVFGRKWLAARPAGKVVKDVDHLRHLMIRYLPSHRGATWVNGEILARVDTRGH